MNRPIRIDVLLCFYNNSREVKDQEPRQDQSLSRLRGSSI
jgi:hypothetical protein